MLRNLPGAAFVARLSDHFYPEDADLIEMFPSAGDINCVTAAKRNLDDDIRHCLKMTNTTSSSASPTRRCPATASSSAAASDTTSTASSGMFPSRSK